MKADHDQVVLAPRVAVDDALGAAVIDDDGQLDEMLKPRELRAVDAAVQEHAVEGIDRVLALLQPVAGRVDGVGHQLVPGNTHAVEDWELGLGLGRSQISKDQSAHLDRRIGALADFAANGAVGFTRRLEDGAVDVEVPAVIAADHALLGDAPELERRAPVGAMLVQQTDAALEIAEHDQILAEDADRHRIGLVLDLRRHGDRVPEPAHVFPARRARPDVCELLVLLDRSADGVAAEGTCRPSDVFGHGQVLLQRWPQEPLL